MQIYIMDSDYEVMKRLESLINNYPMYKPKCFTSYRLLVEGVKKEPPEVVIVDIDTSNGFSVVETIQSANVDIKIIVMSKNKEKVFECFKFRANGFLEKPIDERKLKEQLFRVKHPLLARMKYGSERIASV